MLKGAYFIKVTKKPGGRAPDATQLQRLRPCNSGHDSKATPLCFQPLNGPLIMDMYNRIALHMLGLRTCVEARELTVSECLRGILHS